MAGYHQNKDCIDACLKCAAICNHCAANCLQGQDVQMMARCIQLCNECAVLCYAAAQVMSMGGQTAKELCRIYVDECEACAAECGGNENKHCKECAEACRKCAEECRNMAA